MTDLSSLSRVASDDNNLPPSAADLRAAALHSEDATGGSATDPSQPTAEEPPAPLQAIATPPRSGSGKATPNASPAPKASGGWGSMWGGWVDTVKKQSEAVVDIYKRDISEFVATVASESSSQFEKISDTIKDTIHEITAPDVLEDEVADADNPHASDRRASAMNIGDLSVAAAVPDMTTPTRNDAGEGREATGHGMALPSLDLGAKLAKLDDFADKADELLLKFGSGVSSFLSNAVTIIPGQSAGTGKEALEKAPVAKRNIIFNRKTALVTALRTDAATYAAPAIDDARFQTFAAAFEIGDKEKAQIAKILEETPEVRDILQRLVPSEISYATFWQRYFFRVSELEREEETRKQLLAKAKAATADGAGDKEDEDFSWGSEDEEEENSANDASKRDATMAKPESSVEPVVQMVDVGGDDYADKVTASNQSPRDSAVRTPLPSSPRAASKPQSGAHTPLPVAAAGSPVASPKIGAVASSGGGGSPMSASSPSPPRDHHPAPPQPQVDIHRITPSDDNSSQHSFEVVAATESGAMSGSETGTGGRREGRKGGQTEDNNEEEEEGWGEWE
ncbi:hypothetical protein HDU86_001444 [Geranomyces michiganensis]|nr:hypothetical protein HDU86_001444 [Geranomyces michiganensis]